MIVESLEIEYHIPVEKWLKCELSFDLDMQLLQQYIPSRRCDNEYVEWKILSCAKYLIRGDNETRESISTLTVEVIQPFIYEVFTQRINSQDKLKLVTITVRIQTK